MSYQHILVPVDDSELSEIATRHALFIAQAFGSRVTVMSVVAVDPFVGVDFYKVAPAITNHFMDAEAHAQKHLEQIQQQFLAHQIDT
ncbi:universal stress protein, partial [uncultured Acinetobacter sp.]